MVELRDHGKITGSYPVFSHENFAKTYYKYINELAEYDTKDEERMRLLQERITEYCK